MGLVTITGFVATSDSLPAYGGIALAPEGMYSIAESIRKGKMPLRANHDERTLLHPNILVAEVRKTAKGSYGVWIEFEIDEQEWKEHGDLRAFSIAVVGEPFEPDPTNDKPTLNFYADAGHYDEETFLSVVELLEEHFAVGGGRLYQFNILPPAKIIVDLTLATIQAIPPNLLSSLLYDALKMMLLKQKTTSLKQKKQHIPELETESITCLRIKGEKEQIDLLQVRTNDPQILREALTTFYANVSPQPQGKVFEFDKSSKKWKQTR